MDVRQREGRGGEQDGHGKRKVQSHQVDQEHVNGGGDQYENGNGIDLNLSLSLGPFQRPLLPVPPPPPHALSWLKPPNIPSPATLFPWTNVVPQPVARFPLEPPLPPPLPLPAPEFPPPPYAKASAVDAPSSSTKASVDAPSASTANGGRKRRASVREAVNEDPVSPPYPWATDQRAGIHKMSYLYSNGLTNISGQVICKNCEKLYMMEVDIRKASEVAGFFLDNKDRLHNRAPPEWLEPKAMDCEKCGGKECVRPVVDEKEKRINWLFLLITQSLGYCNLDQLKYFCKHNSIHRTGAKDRLLYVTYLGVLWQLDSQMFPDPKGIRS